MTVQILLEHHALYLYNLALKFTRNDQLAADLYQDTVLRIWQKQNMFAPGTNFKAWAGTIMRNLFVNSLRKTKYPMKYDETVGTTFISNPSTYELNDGHLNVLYADVRHEVEALDEIFRRPFLLYYEGYSYKEIAELLAISEGTVKSRINTARTRLKRRLLLLNAA